MWEDIKAGILAAWTWLKDFGKWFGEILIKIIVWPFKALFYDLPIWIWEKLCEFGNWLYDNYINPYII